MRARRRRTPICEDDDGAVGFRGGVYSQSFVEANCQALMDGFDELPKAVRDQINYAETPETGALPARELAHEIRAKVRDRVRGVAQKVLNPDAIDFKMW